MVEGGARSSRLSSKPDQMPKSHSVLVVVVLFVLKPFYFVYFQ
jgi:hypothetical protein